MIKLEESIKLINRKRKDLLFKNDQIEEIFYVKNKKMRLLTKLAVTFIIIGFIIN